MATVCRSRRSTGVDAGVRPSNGDRGGLLRGRPLGRLGENPAPSDRDLDLNDDRPDTTPGTGRPLTDPQSSDDLAGVCSCCGSIVAEFREHASLAAVWDGAQLVPAPEAAQADATVWFSLPPDPDFPDAPPLWEGLVATPASRDLYVVRACPALFAGVAFGDHVQVVASAEGALVVTAIVASGGYNSARLWLTEGGGSWQEPTELLAKAGCVVDVYSERLVGVSWPEQSNVLYSSRSPRSRRIAPVRNRVRAPARKRTPYGTHEIDRFWLAAQHRQRLPSRTRTRPVSRRRSR